MEPRAGNMANRQETTADRQQTTEKNKLKELWVQRLPAKANPKRERKANKQQRK